MTQVHFRCCNAQGMFIDRCSAAVSDLAELREQAAGVMQSLIMEPSAEDWRGWFLHVDDDLGDEILVVPFASMLGKPH